MFRRRKKNDQQARRDSSPVGWDAITAAMSALYPGVEPLHRAPTLGPAFEGGAGVQGISAYPAADHWHFVTYGLTELYGKESDIAEVSGWGYELTIRVAPRTDEAPVWAFALLDRIAQQTQHAGVVYEEGQVLDAGSPIDGASSLTAIAFAIDPQLGSIDTPNGRVTFLQVVGVTAEELAEMQATDTTAVLARLAADHPLLVTTERR